MLLLKIAMRNIFRNSRRSLMTVSSITVGTLAILLFGQFVNYVLLMGETGTVRRTGHIAIYKKGYFLFGSGSPVAFSIENYEEVLKLLSEDPLIRSRARVVTPTVNFGAIAGNFAAETSKSAVGLGVVPRDYNKMLEWDVYGIAKDWPEVETGLDDSKPERGFVGLGLARILGMCEALRIPNCPPRPEMKKSRSGSKSENLPPRDFSQLPEYQARDPKDVKISPRIELLTASEHGSANIVGVDIGNVVEQGSKQLDETLVVMHFDLARSLVFGQDAREGSGIVLQLLDTRFTPEVEARIGQLLKGRGQELEVLNYKTLNPLYKQSKSFMETMFLFLSAIMATIVLFTVANTMSIAVMERTNEIGTLRSMGVRRNEIRMQFLTEGWLLGVIGATLGVCLVFVFAELVNRSGATWVPVGWTRRVPVKIIATGTGELTLIVWFGLTIAAMVASVIPANRAAKMKIVDALGHV